MASEQAKDYQRSLLEASISKRLRKIPFSDAGLCSGSFFLLDEDLSEWLNPPVDFSYITKSREAGADDSLKFLKVNLEDAEETKNHPAWKGMMISLLPTEEYPQYYPHLTIVLQEDEVPVLLFIPGKPNETYLVTEPRIKIGRFSLFKKTRLTYGNQFEEIRGFEDSDYISLNRIINKLQGPVPK